MVLNQTRYEHIVLDDKGTPLISGTTMKVIELVREQEVYGWSVEELHFQRPYLSLGHIHSALAYYWDHKEVLERDITQRQALVEELQRTTPVPPLVAKLKS